MAELIKIIENNVLIDCPVSKDDINISENIWVPNLVYLKGKTMRQKHIQVRDYILHTPLLISQKFNHINLCADVMKVSTVLFFLSISKNL